MDDLGEGFFSESWRLEKTMNFSVRNPFSKQLP